MLHLIFLGYYVNKIKYKKFKNFITSLITAELLGFKNHIPPFATVSASEMLKGVNYASGSAGILHDTGKHLVV